MKLRFERNTSTLKVFYEDESQQRHLRSQHPMIVIGFGIKKLTASVRKKRMDFVQKAIEQAVERGLKIGDPSHG